MPFLECSCSDLRSVRDCTPASMRLAAVRAPEEGRGLTQTKKFSTQSWSTWVMTGSLAGITAANMSNRMLLVPSRLNVRSQTLRS